MDKNRPSLLEFLLRESRLLSQRLTHTDPRDEGKYDRDTTPRLQYDIPPEYRVKKKKIDPDLEQYDTEGRTPREALKNIPRDFLEERSEGAGIKSGRTMRDLLMMRDQYPAKPKEGMY